VFSVLNQDFLRFLPSGKPANFMDGVDGQHQTLSKSQVSGRIDENDQKEHFVPW